MATEMLIFSREKEKMKNSKYIIENTGGVLITHEYWDCECENDYIHHTCENVCTRCGHTKEEMPNSHVSEVQKHGFIIS